MAILDQSKKPYLVDNDERQFIGIELPFNKSDGIDGWFKSTEITLDAVKQNIKLLLMTERGERLMQPTIGLSLRSLLFEQITPDNINSIKMELMTTFESLLPFIDVNNIDINTTGMDALGRNTIALRVDFFLKRDPNTLSSVLVDL
tara:strand:- start:2511 stop:2948 length:438 start_codon:yes stop_codon:yes gene_type:complete